MHRAVPVRHTPEGWRAVSKGRAEDPDSVVRYLESKFGDALDDATSAMKTLARSMPPKTLARDAYRLYEKFRPSVPAGVSGWGAAGQLDLGKIRALAHDR